MIADTEHVEAMGMCQAPGSTGQAMHGGGVPYRFQLDHMHSVNIRVARINRAYDFIDGKVRTPSLP